MFKSAKNDKVTIAYPHPNEVAHSWTESIIRMMSYDSNHKKRISRGGFLSVYSDSGGIIKSRNFIASEFLKSDSEWILWIDTDMGFQEDSLEKIIEIADPVERPIVGGLCFGQKVTEHDGFGGQRRIIFPTILVIGEDYDGSYTTYPVPVYPINQLVECDATGSAFLLVHKSVYQAIGESGWYNELYYKANKNSFGEDISFCLRAKDVGFKTFVHTGIKTTHLKERWISDIDHWNEIKSTQYDINVDVLTACKTAEDFLNVIALFKSLKSTTGYCKLKVLVTKNDVVSDFWVEDLLCKEKEISVIRVKSNHYPEMMEEGLSHVDTSWFLAVKPNVTFTHGWLDQAFTVAHTAKPHAFVGLSDASPQCLENMFSPAILINKSFVDLNEPFFITETKYFWIDALVFKLKKTNLWICAPNSKVKYSENNQNIPEDIIKHDYNIINKLKD